MDAWFDCPRDRTELTRRTFRGIAYGHCRTCDGLWFTRQDLAAPALAEGMTVEHRAPASVVNAAVPVAGHTPCPACRAPALRPYRLVDTVIDICHYCGGIWLDAPEFGAVAPAYRAWKAEVSRWNDEARPGTPLRPDPPESASAGAEEAALVYEVLFRRTSAAHLSA